MLEEFARQKKINDVIKTENTLGLRFSLILAVAVIIAAMAVAFFIPPATERVLETRTSLAGVVNIIAIAMIIVILAVRRTIYFSPRLFPGVESIDLKTLLRKWRAIDLVLNSLAGLIGFLGLLLALSGFPFIRTFHFFVSSWLVMMILMPIPWKVRDKIRNFEKSGGSIDV